jgi:hypothetical protein
MSTQLPFLGALLLALAGCSKGEPDIEPDPPVLPEDITLVGPKPPPIEEAEKRRWETIFLQQEKWDLRVGQRITIQGKANSGKGGSCVRTVDGSLHLSNSEDYWPDSAIGKTVEITGRLIRRCDAPVIVEGTFNKPRSTPTVPPEVDLVRARRRHWLIEVQWKILGD